jgi:hypothetical protein
VNHCPISGYSFTNIDEIHTDAGSQLLSEELKLWGASLESPIKILSAAPNHQEQNGKPESSWQHIRSLVFKMISHARLGSQFFDCALKYAWQIKSVLPHRNLSLVLSDGTDIPTTSYRKYFGQNPKIGRFKVFGCPCVMKVYVRENQDSAMSSNTLTSKNIIQRGVRGVFVGFPINQAGYEIWVPSSRRFFTSEDVAFDENFSSPLVYDQHLFHDAMPTRNSIAKIIDPSYKLAHTGPPSVLPDSADPNLPWVPYTAIPPENVSDNVDFDPVHIDTFITEEENSPTLSLQPSVERVNTLSSVDVSDAYDSYDFLPFPEPISLADIDDHNNDSNVNDEDSASSDSGDDNISRDASNNDDDDENSLSIEEEYPSSSNDHRRSARTRRPPAVLDYCDLGQSQNSKRVYAMNILSKDSKTMPKSLIDDFIESFGPSPGDPGTDPMPFLPEPKSLRGILKMPIHIRRAWIAAFVKEISGLYRLNSFKLGNPAPLDPVTPVMEVYKAKLDKNGLIDKLKCRVVFRGDLYDPLNPQDSWNPHANFLAVRFFLALCARYNMNPSQADFIMAYLQVAMKEKVFIKFPEFWAHYLPENLKKYCGVPLELLKALYGYTYSGKLLYEEQATFFIEFGLTQSVIPGLWFQRLPENNLLIILHYSDDILTACTLPTVHHDFKTKLSQRFDVEIKQHADWYLQARIAQDSDGNITLDQTRYSMAIVRRYLPNADDVPTAEDILHYADPLPKKFQWTKSDRSIDFDACHNLERQFGFRFIEAVGSLNFLANTSVKQIYAIRKACKHMRLPGLPHFQAMLHLLHHLRCHPTKALKFYRDVTKSPLHKMLQQADLSEVDCTLCWFTDSSFMDEDDQRSTGSHMGFLQGGCIDFSSFVPLPIAQSTAEAETNALCIGSMSSAHVRQGFMQIVTGDSSAPYTVPIFTDSSAAEAISKNDRDTKRTRHIDRRFQYARHARKSGHISVHHVNGDTYQLADLGTKNVPTEEASYKLSIIEAPSTDNAIVNNRRGVTEDETEDENTSSLKARQASDPK